MADLTPLDPAETPKTVGGYAQSLAVTGATELLFVSGQIPETPDGSIPEGFDAQCRLAWANIVSNLHAAGLGVEHLVKVNTYLTDRSHAQANRDVRQEVLAGHRPSSTVVVVETLDPRWLLEIEAVAAR